MFLYFKHLVKFVMSNYTQFESFLSHASIQYVINLSKTI